MTDILLDKENGGLLFKDGDLVIGDSTQQNQRLLLVSNLGDFKANPTVGVGVLDFLDDENPTDLIREIRKQYSADGMQINAIALDGDGTIKVDAEY